MNRYIIPIFFVLLSVGVYVMYIDPTYSLIRVGLNKQKEYTDYLAQAKTAQERIAELKQVQESFPTGYEQALSTILPDTVDSTRLIIDVEGVALARGLHLKAPTVSDVPPSRTSPSSFTKHVLKFAVTAPYSVFRVLLRDLESSLAIRDTSNISFTSVESNNAPVSQRSPELQAHDYSVSVVTYSVH